MTEPQPNRTVSLQVPTRARVGRRLRVLGGVVMVLALLLWVRGWFRSDDFQLALARWTFVVTSESRHLAIAYLHWPTPTDQKERGFEYSTSPPPHDESVPSPFWQTWTSADHQWRFIGVEVCWTPSALGGVRIPLWLIVAGAGAAYYFIGRFAQRRSGPTFEPVMQTNIDVGRPKKVGDGQ